MTEKKESLAKRIGNKAEALATKTKGIAETAQKAILDAADKNRDGKLDMQDLGLNKEALQKVGEKAKEAASVAGEGMKAGGTELKKQLGEAKLELDKKVLRPVFAEGNAVCAGAVGYWSTIKGVELLNLYEDAAEQINVTFFPNPAESFYYANPYLKGFYISLNEYFDYLKKARVDELRTVAQELGAKRVQIAYKEEKKIFVREKTKAAASIGAKKGSVEQEKSNKEYANVEIAADVQFSGNEEPGVPELVYFKNQSEIERLVQMRTGGNKNKVQSEVYKFQCRRMSGMSMAEATKVDAVIAQVKCGATASFSSEVQREYRMVWEDKIDF